MSARPKHPKGAAVVTIRVWPQSVARGLPADENALSQALAPMVLQASENCAQGFLAGGLVSSELAGWWEIKAPGKGSV